MTEREVSAKLPKFLQEKLPSLYFSRLMGKYRSSMLKKKLIKMFGYYYIIGSGN